MALKPPLWQALKKDLDYATVYPDGRVVFTFRNGVEISTEISLDVPEAFGL